MKRLLIFVLGFILGISIGFSQKYLSKGPHEILLKKQYLEIGFNTISGSPFYVGYTLKRSNLNGSAKRGKFREDLSLPQYLQIKPEYYTRSGYDRGHLAPAADFKFSQKAMNETFLMSNIAPQLPGFNRKQWKKIEETVRNLSWEYDSLWVVTGTSPEGFTLPGGKDLFVPKEFWKVVLCWSHGVPIEIKGWICNNSYPVITRNITIEELEETYHRRFFPVLIKRGRH